MVKKMKHLLNYILLLGILNAALSFSMQPEKPIQIITEAPYYTPSFTSPGNYYDLQKFLQIKPTQERHAGCMILLDPIGQEMPTPKASKSITTDLADGIEAGFFPIITSPSLVYNLLSIIDFPVAQAQLQDRTKWTIRDIPGSNFILLVPKAWQSVYTNAGLQFANLTELYAHQINQTFSATKTINKEYFQMGSNQSVSFAFMRSLFPLKEENQTVTWDFILSGHGGSGIAMAGIRFDDMHRLLVLFDHIKTGVAYILSCNAGGKNRTLIETQNQIPIAHQFIMIIGAIADIGVRSLLTKETIAAFFESAAQLTNKGQALDALLATISATIAKNDIASLPQVWLPGGLGFQTFAIKDRVEVLGNVKVKKHELEHQPLMIAKKAAVLIYPPTIGVPVTVSAHEGVNAFPAKNSKAAPANFTIAIDNPALKNQIFNLLADRLQLFPNLYQLRKSQVLSELSFAEFVDAYKENMGLITLPGPIFWPAFISMPPSILAHHFVAVQLEPLSTGYTKEIYERNPFGVLTFLRDAFIIPTRELEGHKNFLIDTLAGSNDLAILDELDHMKRLATEFKSVQTQIKNITNLPALLAQASLPDIQKAFVERVEAQFKQLYQATKQSTLAQNIPATHDITLHNVIVSVSKNFYLIMFSIENNGRQTAWQYKQTITQKMPDYPSWNFQEIPLQEHMDSYAAFQETIQSSPAVKRQQATGQKGLMQILQERP